jgi:hypothetical protein
MTRRGAAPTCGSGGRTSPWREGFSSRQPTVATTARRRAVEGSQASPLPDSPGAAIGPQAACCCVSRGASPCRPVGDYLNDRATPPTGLQRPDQPGVCQVSDPFAHVPPLKITFIAQLPVYTDDELVPLQ